MGQYTDQDMVTVRLSNVLANGKPLIVASVYMAAENPAPPQRVRELVDHCEREGLPLVIGTDANSHSEAWGSTDTNQRGEELLEFILGSGLDWKNTGRRPTFVTGNRQEVLDLTLTNILASTLVAEWRVDEEPSMSDHRYLRFCLRQAKVKRETYRPIRSANWDVFQKALCEGASGKGTESPTTVEELENRVEYAETQIRSALDKACPLKTKTSKVEVTWWNPRLSKLKANSRRLLEKAERDKGQDSWAKYRECHKEYCREVRRAKRQSWKAFTEQLEGLAPLARSVKMLKKDPSLQLSSIRKPDGELTSSPRETLEHMIQHHVPGATDPVEPATVALPPQGIPEEELEKIVSEERMGEALKAFHPYKSAGTDEISPIALQKIWETPLKEVYKGIFKASLRLGHIPTRWKEGKGVFLPKPGKGAYDTAKAFRMITLTSFPLKWLERLVLWYLERDCPISERMDQRQFGFRSGMSTDTALHNLTRRIEKAMEEGEYALGVFLDIENAFPTVSKEGITRALSRLKVPMGVAHWISGMLSDRTITVTLADSTVRKQTSQGCPQGGILSPFLWNAVLDSFLQEMGEKRTYAQAYADDIAGLFVGIDPSTIVDRAQEFLDSAVRWGRSNGLTFSQAKTEVVVFTRKRGWNPRRQLRMSGQGVGFSKEAKYLGVTLDSKLLYTAHVRDRVKKAVNVCAQANRLIGKTWGLSPGKARWIYTTMVRPILSYGCLVWIRATLVQTNVNILRKVQRLACVMMTSAQRSAPTAALEVMMDLRPVDLFLQEQAVLTSVRLQHMGQWQMGRTNQSKGSRKTHVDICNDLRTTVPGMHMPWDKGKPKLQPPRAFTTIVEGRDAAKATESRLNRDIKAYTDGSKLEDGRAGSGVILEGNIPRETLEVHLGRDATVFQAEVTAITMMAEALLHKGVQGKQVTVFTDSQATIKALGKRWISERTTQECVARLNELSEANDVHVRWIPGHEGVAGNEAADEAAKAAAQLKKVEGPEPFIPLPASVLKANVRDHFTSLHDARWKATHDCRQSKEAMPGTESSIASSLMRLSRGDMWLVTQMITGHCNLARHGVITGRASDALCPKCFEEEETPNHHVGECAYYEVERRTLLGKNRTSLREVLDARNVKSLARYLSTTNRLREFAQQGK
jgi:ribonuclease HI